MVAQFCLANTNVMCKRNVTLYNPEGCICLFIFVYLRNLIPGTKDRINIEDSEKKKYSYVRKLNTGGSR
jgi:hypothetical protein